MPSHVALQDPGRFGLESFAQILAARDPILGEDPGSFDTFHDGMMASLAPLTPYECVIAENLVAIEWELLQHRRMRDICIRQPIREAIRKAVIAQHSAAHEAALDAAFERFIEAGGDENAWDEPFEFDADAAARAGEELAARAVSPDRDAQAKAHGEITALGLQPFELMSEAYNGVTVPIARHEAKIQDLERRRREVKRDFDSLQKARPLEGEIIVG